MIHTQTDAGQISDPYVRGSVTNRTDRRTHRQTSDKVIPMCCYASQAKRCAGIIKSDAGQRDLCGEVWLADRQTHVGQISDPHTDRRRTNQWSLCEGKCDYRTDRRTHRQTPDKVIPMCRYASQATQKLDAPKFLSSGGIKRPTVSNIPHPSIFLNGFVVSKFW